MDARPATWCWEQPVGRDLADHLACVWHADVGGPERTLVPDACMDLLWISNGSTWLCGPETSSWTFSFPEGTSAVGVRFRPAAAAAVLRLDASDVHNTRVRIDDLWGSRAGRTLQDQIDSAVTPAGRIAALAGAVRDRLDGADSVDPVAATVADRMSTTHGATVRGLARDLGVSERKLHRRTVAAFGYGPSVLARILRVQRFLSAARASGRPTGLAELAVSQDSPISPISLAKSGRSRERLLPRCSRVVDSVSDRYKTPSRLLVHNGRMSDILDRYHHIADGFSTRAWAVPPTDKRWDAAAPCDGWIARDVVRHLIEANNIFFGLVDHNPGEPTCSVDNDPSAAWEESRAAMESALGDPAVAGREFDGMFGRSVWADSIDRFLTDDVLVHTWDLARATGLDEQLDSNDVHRMYAELTGRDQAMQDAMRRPDVYGPPIDLPPGAPEQDRLIAFTGRDPR